VLIEELSVFISFYEFASSSLLEISHMREQSHFGSLKRGIKVYMLSGLLLL